MQVALDRLASVLGMDLRASYLVEVQKYSGHSRLADPNEPLLYCKLAMHSAMALRALSTSICVSKYCVWPTELVRRLSILH